MPCSAQYRTTPSVSDSRKNGLRRFCTDVMGTTLRLPDLVHDTFDSPIQRTLPSCCELGHRADALGERHPGIGRVELVQIHPLDAERPEGPLAGRAECAGLHRCPTGPP